MRQYLLAALVAAAGLAVGAAVVVLDRHAPEPGAVPPVASAPAPAEAVGGGEATASLPPSVPEAAPAPAPDAMSAPPASAGATPPAKPAGSDLPNVDVEAHTVHAVPDAEPSAPPVTVVDRNGRTIRELKPSDGLAPGYVPSVGPGGAASSASRGSTRPILVPPVSNNPQLAMVLPGAVFNGRGSAGGGTTLSVAGHNLRLFGIRLADPRDRCGLGAGDNRSCGEVARDALAQRLQHYPNVACRVPPGQHGSDQAAICTDNSGTDLAGFLVGEGYALADTHQSFDYFGAESAARANRRGLWRYR